MCGDCHTAFDGTAGGEKVPNLVQFKGDLVPWSGQLHQHVQPVHVAQVGRIALGARRAVWVPSCVIVDVAAELSLSSGHVRAVRVVVGVPKAVAEGACAAADGRPRESGERVL